MGKQRTLDVWLVDANKVYAAVPFTVVADWLVQGRLVAADRVRLNGNQKWHAIEAVPALAPYLPQPEPTRADDRAEALEPVGLGLDWGRRHEEEDEDVDMIPLIDISLVLLIFFMMTASIAVGTFTPIDTPPAAHQLSDVTKDSFWVGIEPKSQGGLVEKGDDGRPLPWFSLGRENDVLVPPTRQLDDAIGGLGKLLESAHGEAKVRLRADRTLPIETVQGVTVELQRLEARINGARDKALPRVAVVVQGEVSEPQGQ